MILELVETLVLKGPIDESLDDIQQTTTHLLLLAFLASSLSSSAE